MTDRTNGFLVVLDETLRVDDAADLVAAIEQLKGVGSVRTVVLDLNDSLIREQCRTELASKMSEALISTLAPEPRPWKKIIL